MGWVKKRYRWAMAALSPVLLYLVAAFVGSLIPVNGEWVQPAKGVTIYVVDNGYHTGLILPAAAQGIDLSMIFRPTDLPDPEDAGDYLIFGWGDREFYLNTPTWADLKPQTALAAFIGSKEALLHVDHITRPEEAYGPRPIRLTDAQYRRLVMTILRATKRGEDGRPVAIPGYGSRDVFYPAYGRYHVFQTCNNWTRDVLAAAGVRVGLWTPFSGGVMRWFSQTAHPE
jgi:uncharacterized protein (TIGR02117 family)